MLALAAEDGVTDIVATPHCNYRFEFNPERCSEELQQVRCACPHAPRLFLGCELYFIAENIKRVLARPERYTLNAHDCLLVELPNGLAANAIETGLKAFHRAGLRTVIAHPERNLYLQRNPSIAARIVEFGCYFQITAQSLSGAFGSAAEESAARMLRERLVHFIASDCHDARQRKPLSRSVYTAIAGQFGESTAELLFVLNPRSAIYSQPIQSMRPARRSSTIYRILNSARLFSRSKRWSATV